MPEPDVSVARGEPDDYLDLDPGPDDVALIVKVSDTTLAADRALAAIYGGGRIPVYWIVNLIDRQIEVYANVHFSEQRPASATSKGEFNRPAL